MPVHYQNYKTETIRGRDTLKLDSILGPLSIIRVHSLVVRNKHYSIMDFTNFFKIIFSLIPKIHLVYNLTFLD